MGYQQAPTRHLRGSLKTATMKNMKNSQNQLSCLEPSSRDQMGRTKPIQHESDALFEFRTCKNYTKKSLGVC